MSRTPGRSNPAKTTNTQWATRCWLCSQRNTMRRRCRSSGLESCPPQQTPFWNRAHNPVVLWLGGRTIPVMKRRTCRATLGLARSYETRRSPPWQKRKNTGRLTSHKASKAPRSQRAPNSRGRTRRLQRSPLARVQGQQQEAVTVRVNWVTTTSSRRTRMQTMSLLAQMIPISTMTSARQMRRSMRSSSSATKCPKRSCREWLIRWASSSTICVT
mmetsp:Transcript_59296/g.150152  ORF Transcript_59296/g.150152 Transcript_59296/m.150152 type:complete len:215 (-) Transcript_59296:304-948(-)